MAYIAPHSPVADWRPRPEGEGYGNLYDPVTDTYATVTRATPKTARTADGRIVDVPAGKLALEPWSLHHPGGKGMAAMIEESRTNYLLNSYGAANNGSKWTTGWSIISSGMIGSPLLSIVNGTYGQTAQRAQYIGGESDGGGTITFDNMTSVGSFAPTESATQSIGFKGSLTGVIPQCYLIARDAVGTYIGQVVLDIAPKDSWQRKSLTYSALPENTSRCTFRVIVIGIDTGDSVDITIDAAQLEKGAFPTSYIPTTTTTATRAADNVAVPTTGWRADNLTVVVVVDPSKTDLESGYYGWNGGGNDRLALYSVLTGSTYVAFARASGVTSFDSRVYPNVPHAIAGRWDAGNPVRLVVDGVLAARSDVYTVPVGLPATASLGDGHVGSANAPIQRVIIYDTALPDPVLSSPEMTTGILSGVGWQGGIDRKKRLVALRVI